MPKGNPLAGIPAGTSEVYGVEMRRLQSVIDVIRDTYETFGFDPLHTPVLENAETFHGHHGEGEKLLFRFSDSGGNPLVNRYDLTVPLARFAASHPEVPRPFKRYQIAPVFRDDTPDLGHFREFTQCDGDTIGNSDPSSDAEVINVAYSGLSRLGFSDFTIRVNHRGIIKAIAEKAGVNDEQGVITVQRALDFSDKVTKSGVAGIRSDLEEYGAPSPVISVITELLSLDFDDPLEKLSALESSLGFSATGRTALGELRVILEMLPANVLEKTSVDLTLARGADYYTGFILEGIINDVPVGAVLGGGRYDNLVGKFGDAPEPAVGMAFGLERIITAMKVLDMFDNVPMRQRAIIVGDTSTDQRYALSDLIMALRHLGISVDYLPFGVADDIDAYAEERDFAAVVKLRGNSISQAYARSGEDLFLARVLSLLSGS